MKKVFEIPKLPDGKIDFKKMTEEEGPDDIDQYFTKSQLTSMSSYERLRYCNMKKNYEMMIKLGLPAKKPDFMEDQKKRKQVVSESDSDEEWKPRSAKTKTNYNLPAKKPDFMKGQQNAKNPDFMKGRKKKKKGIMSDSDSDEEWKPRTVKTKRKSSKTLKLKGTGKVPPSKSKVNKKEAESKIKLDHNSLLQVKENTIDKGTNKEQQKHRYPQRKIPMTNYMYLEVPDDDEFIYCEDCEREYEGDCTIHASIQILDSKTSSNGETRAVETLPEWLSIRQSRIPNAGLGVWADKLVQNRSWFGPYQGEITKDVDKAHSTGYAWQIYVDGVPSHFIDAYDKCKSNWMRYVNCARNEEEQNLIAYQYKGEIYYRSFKEIQPDTELLVWYGQDYGKDLGIDRFDIKSSLKPKIVNGEEIYGCPLCTIKYSNERYLSNHLKFRHGTKLEWLLNPVPSQTDSVYQCKECGKTFQTQILVQQHYQFIHKGDVCQHAPINMSNSQTCKSKTDYKIVVTQKNATTEGVNSGTISTTRCNSQTTGMALPKPEIDLRNEKFYNSIHMHKKTSDRDKCLKCDVCGKGFSLSHHLKLHIRTHTGDKLYICDVCGSRFNDSSALQRHMRKHTGDKTYKCDVCSKWFSDNSALHKHTRTHTGDTPYKCDDCGKGFIQDGDLQKHIRTHTGDKSYICDICSKGFSQASSLQTHMRTHTGDKPYKCDVCGKGFSVNFSLQTHMRTHTGDKAYKCDVCGKWFSHISSLQTHMRTHTGDKPYKCDVCGKWFIQNGNLQTHMRTHTGYKPYKCDVCGKGFIDNSNLQKHMRTHTGDKPYECDICGKGFSQNSNLQRHIRTHTGDKPYKCDVCDKGFTQSNSLQIHMRTHTGDKPYKCDVCGKGFSHISSLQTHMTTHTGDKPYKCDVCDKGFTRSNNLQRHMRTHTGDKPYNCDVCAKGFIDNGNLQKHMRTHTGDKPYKCDVCRKGFSQNGALHKHIRTHTGDV